jgi:hypothetical protein
MQNYLKIVYQSCVLNTGILLYKLGRYINGLRYKVRSTAAALWSPKGDPTFWEILLCIGMWTLHIFYSECIFSLLVCLHTLVCLFRDYRELYVADLEGR